MWNEPGGSKIRYDTDADMEITEKKHEESRSGHAVPGAHLNLVPQECGARMLTVPSQCLVKDDGKHSFF
jgi:hypothetical protein